MRHYLNKLHGNDGLRVVKLAQNDTIRTPSLKVGKDEVAGSNPAISSIEKPCAATVPGLFLYHFCALESPLVRPFPGA